MIVDLVWLAAHFVGSLRDPLNVLAYCAIPIAWRALRTTWRL